MSEKKEFQLFDNYEEDGQLSLFSPDYDDWDEDWPEDETANVVEGALTGGMGSAEMRNVSEGKSPQVVSAAQVSEYSGPDIRVKYCASCGKLLFVREDTAGFHSECNNCGIKYFQKN